MTTCTFYTANTAENSSIWHHAEHFHHYVFTVLEDCFRKMFQIKMSMFVSTGPRSMSFRSIFSMDS